MVFRRESDREETLAFLKKSDARKKKATDTRSFLIFSQLNRSVMYCCLFILLIFISISFIFIYITLDMSKASTSLFKTSPSGSVKSEGIKISLLLLLETSFFSSIKCRWRSFGGRFGGGSNAQGKGARWLLSCCTRSLFFDKIWLLSSH